MRTYEIFAIYLIFSLTPTTFGRNTINFNDVEEQVLSNTTPRKPVLVYAFDNLSSLGKEYIARGVEISRNILKDEELIANDKPEVETFKNNLKQFVEKYDNSRRDVQDIWILMENFGDIWQKYYKMPKDEKSPEAKFILDILNKYGCESNNREFINKFHVFADGFIAKFEESKDQMDKGSVAWLEEFKASTEFSKKFAAVLEYVIIMG
ncbi:hypothetical protein FF38_12687 [Lucilia cuprina]|uniref:Uncharacterized protein n=1 Tax=Lucilia cuprina TaxID=7375 RepID=A0A0L0C482_LUCCU|nr:hypothetical protein CVS40_7847 [Lucilia cuprina]KNC27095.1 hypothetical protein FF38_12687 [Lucilia cuprina]